jgi:hypothetical protein
MFPEIMEIVVSGSPVSHTVRVFPQDLVPEEGRFAVKRKRFSIAKWDSASAVFFDTIGSSEQISDTLYRG